jgi:multicomponent Na+:H+ antiporter subunit C
MLTGIVVSVSTTAVALALIIRIYKAYGTIEEDAILAIEKEGGEG